MSRPARVERCRDDAGAAEMARQLEAVGTRLTSVFICCYCCELLRTRRISRMAAQLLKRWTEHHAAVQGVAFRPDGRLLASCANDGLVCLWEWKTGRLLWKWEFSGALFGVTFSPDGRHLAVGGEGAVWLCAIPPHAPPARAIACSGEVLTLAFSPDGQRFAAGSTEGITYLWNPQTQLLLGKLSHDDGVHGLAFSPDNRFLAIGTQDGWLSLWEAQTGHRLARESVPRLGFPQGEPSILSAYGEEAIIGAEGQAVNAIIVGKFAKEQLRLRVPKVGYAFRAACREALPIGAKCEGQHLSAASNGASRRGMRRNCTEPDSAFAPHGKMPSIRTEGHAKQRARELPLPEQSPCFLFPEAHQAIVGTTGEQAPIGAKGNSLHRGMVFSPTLE